MTLNKSTGCLNVRKLLLGCCILLAGTTVPAAEPTVYRDCFRIVPGGIPHLACTVEGLTGIDYAVDEFSPNAWRVTFHGTGVDDARVKKAPAGEHYVNDNNMPGGVYEVTGTTQPFIFEFCNWYRNGALGSSTWYGYISLTRNAENELVILESAICNRQNVLKVVVPDENDPIAVMEFEYIEYEDHIAISGCSPRDAVEQVVIPSEINGKPVRSLAAHAFNGCSKMTGITIPDGILDIGNGAFSGCSSLKELSIPSSVTNVGECAVMGCDALSDLRIDAALTSLSYMAFARTGVTNLVLASGITNIDAYALADSPRLESVTFPQSVRRICKWSFCGDCRNLKIVRVPYATVVEDDAFPSGCAVNRYGPVINASVSGPQWRDVDEETKIALMRTLDPKDYESAETLQFIGWSIEESAVCPEPPIAAVACAHLGISNREIQSLDDEGRHKGVYYKMPSVEITGFDPAARTITGRVVPAAGTRIVSTPLRRAFGFKQYFPDDNGSIYEVMDWGERLRSGNEGFEVDYSSYLRDGIFRISFPDYLLTDKHPNFFRLSLHDNEEQFW